jgi:hypothetical protein
MRFILFLLLSLGIALGLGAASARWALEQSAEIGTVRVGAWHADPLIGSVDADPYAKARLARTGNLTLGIGEGIVFRAETDSEGRRLQRNCRYRLEGDLPVAQVWTLVPYASDGRLLQPGEGRPGWLLSDSLMRDEANAFTIQLGPRAAPGNWLALSGTGSFLLALTLYDTPASASSGLSDLALPRIVRTDCLDV